MAIDKITYIKQYHQQLLAYSMRLKQLIDANSNMAYLLRTNRIIEICYDRMIKLSTMMNMLELVVSDLYLDLKAEETRRLNNRK